MNLQNQKLFTRVPLRGALYIFSLLFLLESCSSVSAVKNGMAGEQDHSLQTHKQIPANPTDTTSVNIPEGMRVRFLKNR